MSALLGLCLALSTAQGAVLPGDLAFIGYNADGQDDFAIVALADLTAEALYLTDKESDGLGGLTSGEGVLLWETGLEVIPAGTVVVFTDLTSSAPAVGHGTVSKINASFNLAASGDGILVFQGVDETAPSVFVAGIESGAGAIGDLTTTGLTYGVTVGSVSTLSHDDGAKYIGVRGIADDFDAYLVLINGSAWETSTTDGESLLPFDATVFIANWPRAVPVLGTWGLLAMGFGLAGAGTVMSREED